MTGDQLEQAACKGKPLSWWMPTNLPWRAQDWRDAGARALAICATCSVIEPCRAEAIATHELQAIRGGLTPPELSGTARRPASVVGRATCWGCGGRFDPHSVLQRYCSMTCAERVRRGGHVNEKVS